MKYSDWELGLEFMNIESVVRNFVLLIMVNGVVVKCEIDVNSCCAEQYVPSESQCWLQKTQKPRLESRKRCQVYVFIIRQKLWAS